MELREEERRMKQRELWRQHEMNCMLIGADPRFTAPFDPSKGFQYIWNPSLGQWQALPVPSQSSGPTPQGNIYIRLVYDQFTLKNYSNFIYFSFLDFSFVVILFDNFFFTLQELQNRLF